MAQLQPVRGTHDLLSVEMRKYRLVVNTALRICANYGYEEIKTPIFEFSQVFARTLGDASDIVSKEMYTFQDKGGDSLSLRPEGTAGVVRAFISEGLAQHMPLKLSYEGPMFRYERPQKGRYRQFYQIGAELIGTDSVEADIEVISMASVILRELGVADKVFLEINSIGDKESRDRYRAKLVEYYSKHKSSLSEDSQKRLGLNPLRILDSKDKKDIAINQDAPKLLDHLNDSSKHNFSAIQEGLKQLKIDFKINQQLVRGLDYYNHMVFEFKTEALGAQDAVLSGGRYDGLSELMGGPKAPSIGWAAGVERLCLLLPGEPVAARPVTIIPLGEAAEKWALAQIHDLRAAGLTMDMAYSGNMSNRMKKANAKKAVAAVIVGDSELAAKEATVKMLDSGTQEKVAFTNLKDKLKSIQS